MKVVCIGNSIVNGFPHRRSQSFPSVLRTLTGWEVINKGVNGDSTAGVLARFPHDVLVHRPDLVLILTGANDFILSLATPQEALDNLAQMAKMALDAGIRPVFLTPVGTNPVQASAAWMTGAGIDYQSVNARLDTLSEGIRRMAGEGTCGLVDLELEYKGFGKFVDGIHPTEEGQAFLARRIAEALNGEKQP